jgi:hypothetical protein
VTVGVALPSDDEDEESQYEDEEGQDEEDDEEDDEEGESEKPKEGSRNLRNPQPERDDSNRDQMQTLENQVERLAIGGTETVERDPIEKYLAELMQDADYRQITFNSYCVVNDLRGVASLLETYKDDPFVNWRDKNGVNCIALAAVEGHDKMIELLQDKGGDLNNADRRGRTPLMEAALWGRLKAVESLLKHGADPCVKDRKGRRAYFYSRPSRRTARMREAFSHYQEKREDEPNRRIIAIKLQAFEPVTAVKEETSSGSNQPKHGRFVTTTTVWGTQIGFYEQSVTYDVPDPYKTVARLDRGMLFPVVSAASGWRTDFAVEHVLDNRLWRDRALELCQLIGYALPEHDRDEPTRPGSYYASHAEKKLVAYYISQHVILSSALVEGVDANKLGEWMQQDLELQHLVTLCSEMPRVRASIRVSRAICSDCELFISHIRAVLGVSFTVEHC